jgi:hypothetical protein
MLRNIKKNTWKRITTVLKVDAGVCEIWTSESRSPDKLIVENLALQLE